MTTQIIIALLQLAMKVIEEYPKIREAATTEDRAALDAVYEEFKGRSNAVADRLRAAD
jgi:hypothetical protein